MILWLLLKLQWAGVGSGHVGSRPGLLLTGPELGHLTCLLCCVPSPHLLGAHG